MTDPACPITKNKTSAAQSTTFFLVDNSLSVLSVSFTIRINGIIAIPAPDFVIIRHTIKSARVIQYLFTFSFFRKTMAIARYVANSPGSQNNPCRRSVRPEYAYLIIENIIPLTYSVPL